MAQNPSLACRFACGPSSKMCFSCLLPFCCREQCVSGQLCTSLSEESTPSRMLATLTALVGLQSVDHPKVQAVAGLFTRIVLDLNAQSINSCGLLAGCY